MPLKHKLLARKQTKTFHALGRVLIALTGTIILCAPYGNAQHKMNPLQTEAMRLNWTIVTAAGLPNSPELIKIFDTAAILARQGNYNASLSTFNKLLSPAPKGAKLIASSEFLGHCYMRKAWVLMDLQKYPAAKATMLEPVVLECLATFIPQDKASYHFSLANIMGNLKDQAGLEKEMKIAIGIYKSQNQSEKIDQCYNNMLDYARIYGWKSFQQRIMNELVNGH